MSDTADFEMITLTIPCLGDEEIVFIRHKSLWKKAKQMYPDKVIYFPEELEVIMDKNLSEEAFATIHKIKKVFHGFVIPESMMDA